MTLNKRRPRDYAKLHTAQNVFRTIPGHPRAADEAWYWLKCVLHLLDKANYLTAFCAYSNT